MSQTTPRAVAWKHTLWRYPGEGNEVLVTEWKQSPFGVPGQDHSLEYGVTSEALILRDPKVKRPDPKVLAKRARQAENGQYKQRSSS